MIPTDLEIKTAIRSIIQAADPTAVVYRKFVLDLLTGENPNLLRSSSDGNRVHGWMIGRGQQANKRHGKPRFADDQDATSYRIDSSINYNIWFFYEYVHGDEDANTDSTRKFEVALDAVIEAFAKKPRFNIATGESNQGNQLWSHGELQVPDDPDIVSMGAVPCHFAPCILVVNAYRTPAG